MNQAGILIKKFRIRAGLSQFDLECKINAAFGSISRIENGKVDPSKETINRIVHELKLSTHEAGLLYALDINQYRSLISSINRIHAQSNLLDTVQVAANEMFNIVNLQGSAIFILEGEELVLKVLSQDWYTKKVLDIVSVHISNIRYRLDSDIDNGILQAARIKKLVMLDTLFECITPMLGKKTCDFIQRLIKFKGVGIVPILGENNELVGVMPFSYGAEDAIEEKLPIIMGFGDAVAVAISKFTSNS